MDRLAAMRAFVAVIETGGFSRAAQKLGIGNASVTEAVKSLEKRLEMQLLYRTTRSVRPTYEGAAYYSDCQNILSIVDEVEKKVSSSRSAKGRLVVEVPVGMGYLFVVPALKRFHENNPDIKVVCLLNPGPRRLAEGGIDVALQLGDLKDSNLISRKICMTQYIACASPSYIARHGAPNHPQELNDRNCMGFFSPRNGRITEWEFTKGNKTICHLPAGSPNFNSSVALIEMALLGGGIIYSLDILVRGALKEGRLVPVLTDWKTLHRPLYILYPQKRYLTAKVKTFIKFLESLDFTSMKR
jgi:LysR family transcriptional regulator for bpeEF and oprC